MVITTATTDSYLPLRLAGGGMVLHHNTTRRAILAAVGSGAIAGTASAADHTKASDGVVIQFEDCQTSHIRGNERTCRRINILSRFWQTEKSTYPYWDMTIDNIYHPDLPITINATELPNLKQWSDGSPAIFDRIAIYTGDDHNQFVFQHRPPNLRDCRDKHEPD